MLTLSGFFTAASNFAPYLIPFEYLSVYKYAYQLAVEIEFTHMQPLYCANDSVPCDPLVTRFNFKEPFFLSWILLCVLIIFFKVLAFVFLKAFAKLKV